MNSHDAEQCLTKYLEQGSDDTFHSLIEGGSTIAEVILLRLQETQMSTVEFISIMDILKEIRTPVVVEGLLEMLKKEDGERWRSVLEAYWYNHSYTNHAESESTLVSLLGEGKLSRSKLEGIREILQEAEGKP